MNRSMYSSVLYILNGKLLALCVINESHKVRFILIQALSCNETGLLGAATFLGLVFSKIDMHMFIFR